MSSYQKRSKEELAKRVAQADIVISTALIPGRAAPKGSKRGVILTVVIVAAITIVGVAAMLLLQASK